MIEPLTAALESAGVEIARETAVTSVSCTDGRVTEIGLEGDQSEEVDELILAVPETALLSLVRAGESGHRVVDALPRLAEVSRLQSQRIPIVHLYFKRKLRNIPPEPVGLFGSELALAFTDISQTWEGVPGFRGTVLSLSSSDLYGLPGTGADDDAMAMLRGLADYLDFDPGERWGQSRDIDWKRTRFESNTDATLFVNETGSDIWRPPVACEGLDEPHVRGRLLRQPHRHDGHRVRGHQRSRRGTRDRRTAWPREAGRDRRAGLRFHRRVRVAALRLGALRVRSEGRGRRGSDWLGSMRHLLTPTRPPER